jgi:hypothetical protein
MKYYDVKNDIDELIKFNKGYIFIQNQKALDELKSKDPLFNFISPAALPVFVQHLRTIGEIKIISADSVLFEKELINKKLKELTKSDPELKESIDGLYQTVLTLSKTINKEFFIVEKKLNLLTKGD